MQGMLSKAVLAIAFFAVFILEWYTPIHSDDYRYALIGLSFDAHWHHYMTWSGRLVADYTSALLLASNSRLFISTMTGLGAIAFCYFIVKTPTGTLKWKKHDALIFAIVFLTFWLANPNVGQVVFWVVGSANYLWTNLFVAAWIWNLYRLQTQNERRTQGIMLLLGLLAGCSNESVAPFVVGLALLAIVYDFWRYRQLFLNKCLYFISTLLGASILVFSPGNFVRAQNSHAAWYSRSIFERLTIHLSERFFNHLALIWIAYVVLALLAVVAVAAYKKGHRFNKFNLGVIVLMLLVGVGTSLIMVASPSYPDRVMMSTFLFFLLAISFLLRELVAIATRAVMSGLFALCLLLCAVFAWSWTLMYNAYIRVYQQDNVRISVVNAQLSQGKRNFTIPDFYFLKMQNSGGHFGFFHDPHIYAEYFGAGEVAKKKVAFDYSVLATGERQVIDPHTVARYNGNGDLMLVSTRPLSGTLRFTIGSAENAVPIANLKAAQINNEYWYYTSTPKGQITQLSLTD
ncbi:DUF6056 family protein [Intestinirhabdus alba]|jgi:hypothetical protein|uniref:Uncharacterized protein n=1 Tax=Intestinirhabdus alba TaxID=2899544 RepID=A0A6L6IHY0_9ENTR|nr:DUF6056 family protein [Intestinirhabdus alba]MTH46482.1 hypothetical protein [Intestinirhabdus alba]